MMLCGSEEPTTNIFAISWCSVANLGNMEVMTPSAQQQHNSEYQLEALRDLFTRKELVEQVEAMLEEVESSDGVAAISEAFLKGINDDAGHRHIIATLGDKVVGFVTIDINRVVELAVHPSYRHDGLAIRLIKGLKDKFDITGAIDVWAHGDLPEAQRFVSNLDARRTRELHKMAVACPPDSSRKALFDTQSQQAHQRAEQLDIDVLNYTTACERFGADVVDEEWLRVNNEAFAWHPEQGGWSLEQLQKAREVSWFDPEGVILIWKDDENNSRCMGFHWTKIPVNQQEEAGKRTGEVYVVCLADEARGKGMGGGITALGIEYLLKRGCSEIELYVEGDNAPAVATYRRLGFDVVHTDVVYRGQL